MVGYRIGVAWVCRVGSRGQRSGLLIMRPNGVSFTGFNSCCVTIFLKKEQTGGRTDAQKKRIMETNREALFAVLGTGRGGVQGIETRRSKLRPTLEEEENFLLVGRDFYKTGSRDA